MYSKFKLYQSNLKSSEQKDLTSFYPPKTLKEDTHLRQVPLADRDEFIRKRFLLGDIFAALLRKGWDADRISADLQHPVAKMFLA